MNSSKNQHQALFDSIPQSGLKSDIIFLVIKNRIQEEPDYVKRLRVVFQFNILKDGQPATTWTCDTKSSLDGDIYRSIPKTGVKADCILTVEDDDWVKIIVGRLNPQRAFMMSKFKVKGNIMLLQKLYRLWYDLRQDGRTPELDLVQEIMVEEPLLPGLKSEVMAIELLQRFIRLPHLVKDMEGTIQINVLKEGQLMTQYMIGVHPGKRLEFKRLFNGLIDKLPENFLTTQRGKNEASATFTIEDDDLVLAVYGVEKWASLVESDRLKVEGNALIAEQVRALLEHSPILAKL